MGRKSLVFLYPSVSILQVRLASKMFNRCILTQVSKHSGHHGRLERTITYTNGKHRNPAYLIEADHGAVASENERCSIIGVNAMKDGGNAVDAAISAALCTGVVNMFSQVSLNPDAGYLPLTLCTRSLLAQFRNWRWWVHGRPHPAVPTREQCLRRVYS